MKGNKYKTLLSNTMIFAMGNILIKLISFILMPLYTSYLTSAQYNTSELLNSTIEIVIPIATLCIIDALYRFSIDDNADYSTMFANAIFITLIGDIIIGILCCVVFMIIRYQFIIDFFILLLSATFYKLVTQFARGLGESRKFVLYGVTNTLVLVLSNVVLIVFFHGGVRSYLISFSLGYAIAGIFAFVYSKEYIYMKNVKVDFYSLKNMLNYSIPIIPNMLSWWINSVSDRYLLLLFIGDSAAGLYTAASKLPAMINLVSSVFQQAWQYSTAVEINKDDNKNFFTNVFNSYLFIGLITCTLLIMANKFICMILLKNYFFSAWKFVPILLLAATFGCISTYYGTFYQALKNNRMLMISTVIGAVLNIIMNLILIPCIGGLGAAIATAISYFVIMIIRMYDLQRKVHKGNDENKIIKSLFILTLYAAISTYYSNIYSFIIGVIVLLFYFIDNLKILTMLHSNVKLFLLKFKN